MIKSLAKFNKITLLLLIIAIGSTVAISACSSDSDTTAYENERIEIVNPFSPTGGTGRWLALLQPYLEEHIPGNPTVEAVSQSGGAGLNGPNYFENNTASDGFFLLASSGSNVFPYLFNQDGVQFDYNDYTAVLGSPVGGVVYTSPTTDISNVEQFCDASGVTLGIISPTGLDVVLLVALNQLGLLDDGEINVVTGYDGRGDARAAFQTGEIDLDFQTSASYQDNVVPLVDAGTAVPLFTFGILGDDGDIIRDPTYPDLPSFVEVYETCQGSALSGIELEAYIAVSVAGFAAQKNLWVKSDAPQEHIDALLEGARNLVADPDFQTDKLVEVGEYDFSVGADAQAKFDTASNLSDDAHAYIVDYLNAEHGLDLPSR